MEKLRCLNCGSQEISKEERIAQEEIRSKPWLAPGYPTTGNYDKSEFEIESTTLKAYKGNGGAVKIPLGVTSIGKEAFGWCESLTGIVIPDSVTSIGKDAFLECRSLTSIIIPDSVTSIGESAFDWCKSLTSISVDRNNKNYSSQDGILYDKDKTTILAVPGAKTAIIIPNGVTSIGDYAFNGCKSLTSIEMPDSVNSIGEWAFYNCTNLENITIPKGVVSICDGAFKGCKSLTSIEIPDSVNSIGDSAFGECDSLFIKCRVNVEPKWWDKNWNPGNRPVVWGYKGK